MDPPLNPFRLHSDHEAMLPAIQSWDNFMEQQTVSDFKDPNLLVSEHPWSQDSLDIRSTLSNLSSDDHLLSQQTPPYGHGEEFGYTRQEDDQGTYMPESSHDHRFHSQGGYQPFDSQRPVSDQSSVPLVQYFTNSHVPLDGLLDGFGSQFSSPTTVIRSEQEGLNESDLVLGAVMNPRIDDTPSSVEMLTVFGQQVHVGFNVDGINPGRFPHGQQRVGCDVDLGFAAFNGLNEHGDIPRCSPGEVATVATAGTDVTEHVPSAAKSPQPSRLGQAMLSQASSKHPSKAARGPRPNGSKARPDPVEISVTAGGLRWVERTKSKHEILNKLLPKFNEAVHMVRNRNDTMPPPPSAPGSNELYFIDAKAAAKANRIVYWEPLQKDPSIPTSQDEVEGCVRMLVAAIKNNKGCIKSNEDKSSIAWDNRWADGATYFAANVPESVAWKIVDLAIEIHQKGWPDAIGDPKLRQDIYYTMRLSFRERLDLITEVLKLAKDTCGDLIKGKRFLEVVGCPQVVYQRIHCNQQSNKDKKTLIAKGKEAKDKSPEHGENKSTASKRKRKEGDDSVACMKRQKQHQPSIVSDNNGDAKHGDFNAEAYAVPAVAGPSTAQVKKPNNGSRGTFTTKLVAIKPKPNGRTAAVTFEDEAGDGSTHPHKAPQVVSESRPLASKGKAQEGDKSASSSAQSKSTGTTSKRKPKPVVIGSDDEGEEDLLLRSSRGKANQSRVRSAVTEDGRTASAPIAHTPHTPGTVPDRSSTSMYPANKPTRPVPARR